MYITKIGGLWKNMLELDGIRFRSRAEYEDALRDKEQIEQLKKDHDINTFEGVKGIYRELQFLNLSSELGRRFDDEIFELYTKYKNGELTDKNEVKSSGKNADKKNKGRITVPKSAKKSSDKGATKRQGKEPEPLDPALQKEVDRLIRKSNRRRTALIVVLGLISAGCLGYFGNYMVKAEQAESTAKELAALKDSSAASFISVEPVLKKEYDETIEIPEILDEYKVLYTKNKSLIGWVKIDDTKIDYPVMQTVNNEYYLKHNFEQEEDANGCIFLDYRNDVILGNDNLIIYGHHMKSGKMFGTLVKYANEDFYKEHKYIQFDTIYEKGTYEVMYVFRSRIFSSDEITFKYYQFIDANSEAEFDSAMEEMAAMSIIDTGVTARYGDSLLTLSTCDYQETNGRFAVVAKKIY